MKKNAFILAGLCALSIFTWQAQATNVERSFIIKMEDNVPTGYEIIDLRGSLMMGVNPNSINAGANDDAVYIGFNQSFGNVNISIYNGMGGLVYNTVVNTDVQQVFIIPFSGVASGSYIVELNSANGYAEGEFDKD
ncbi:MAG: DUF3244 domain-containing protein [Bacteroidales bacterium]|nr:DUF3244 domain-containing protein [Bacteroidales bacterium]